MQILKVIQEYGWTLEKVAAALGKTKGTFSVSISKNPTTQRLIDIANVLGCSPAEFFGDWETSPENKNRQAINDNNETNETESKSVKNGPTGDSEKSGAEGLPFSNGEGGGTSDNTDKTEEAETVKAVKFNYQCPKCGEKMYVCISSK